MTPPGWPPPLDVPTQLLLRARTAPPAPPPLNHVKLTVDAAHAGRPPQAKAYLAVDLGWHSLPDE